MSEYKEYSKDIWDYLVDMPYLPSRADRDKLLASDNLERVQLWDYFFRIKPDDVGKPQKEEIKEIETSIQEEISKYTQRRGEISDSIRENKRTLLLKRIKNIIYGASCLIAAVFVYRFVVNSNFNINWIVACTSPLFVFGLAMWGAVSIVGWNEKREIRDLMARSGFLREEHNNKIEAAVGRKNFLKLEIKGLKKQIPKIPSGSVVRQWLEVHLIELLEESKRVTGLGNRLISIDSQNPIPVFGPGELQNPDRFPPTFKDINASDDINFDVRKHLTARRAFEFADGRIDVLYGIYYLEYILIADDMLATHGLFYDFITGKSHAIKTTEQYYEDVVSIVITNEFRWIEKGESENKSLYVEDAPTFTLSLASGESRTVTFVNEKYFLEIKDKIDVAEENISKIYLIQDSRTYADNAIKALRHQLRLHKSLENDNE